MLEIGLVACGKQKLDHPAPARALYTSDLFRKASAYAETRYDCWFVLSAKHGLVAPDELLAPYDLTLAGLAASTRRRWAEQVAGQLAERQLGAARFYLHAGALYRRDLERLLEHTVLPFGRPLAIGEQKAWYLSRLPAAARAARG